MSNLTSAIETAGGAISDFTSSAEKQIESFQNLLNVVNKFPAGLDSITKSFGALSDGIDSIEELSAAMNELKNVQTLVTQASTATKDVMKVMQSPVMAVVTVLGLLYATNEEFRNSINALIGQLVSSLQPIMETLISVISTVISVGSELLTSVLNAILPILNTLTPLIGALLTAIMPVIDVLLHSINEVLPVLASAIDPIITLLGDLIGNRLEFLVPILEALIPVLEVLADFLSGVIGRAVQQFSETFGKVLMPVLDTVIKAIEFLCQLFTGDFKSAAEAFKDYFLSIGDAVLDVIIGLVQCIIDAVAATINFFVDMINAIIKLINKLPFVDIKLIGHVDWSDATSNWKLPAMASGGIITSPTYALVGEGRYPEAVIPLGDSPQFTEMKAEIARAVVQGLAVAGQYESNKPIEVVVNIDSREIARATERGKRLNSANRIANVGGVL